MASLTHTAYVSRKLIKYGGVGLVAFVVLWSTLSAAVKAYRAAHPPYVAPTVRYGVLPKTVFPTKEFNKKNFTLELPNDAFPKFKDQAKVYVIFRPSNSFLALESDTETAKGLGFNIKPNEIRPGLYQFSNPNLNQTLIMNVLDGSFKMEYPYQNDQMLLTPGLVPSKNDAVSIAKSFLRSGDKWKEDLESGVQNVSFMRIDMNILTEVKSQAEANLVRVDFFRKYFDDEIKMMASEPNKASISVLVSGSTVEGKRIVEANYKYINIDRQQFSTYPIKNVTDAWEELKNGNYWPAQDSNKDNVTIRRVYLAYFEPITLTNYLQPVYVFEGDDNFIAYVPAVSEKYVSQSN